MEVQRNLRLVALDVQQRDGWLFATPREAPRRVTICELCYNSHPVIIFGPPLMTRRRVWASLGIRLESVWNPFGIHSGIRLESILESVGNPVHLIDSFSLVHDPGENRFQAATGTTNTRAT